MSQLANNYQTLLSSLKERIRQSRFRAISVANTELLRIYWEIGAAILQQQDAEGWGAKIVDLLA